MPTAPLVHAIVSAAAVGLLLTTLRKAGPRAGGLAAAVPINSIPALFWLSLEHGGGYATSAVVGSLWGTGLTVLLGASFARMALAVHAALAGLLAWLAIGALVALTWAVPAMPAAVAVLTLGAIVFGQVALPRSPAHDVHPGPGRRNAPWLSMAAAGAMSLLVTELSHHSGPQLCGLIAAIPVVGMFALHAGYRQGGAPLMLRVLGGYLDGMAAKAAFLGTLALAWALDAGAWAWPIGIGAAAVALAVKQRLRERTRTLSVRRQLGLGDGAVDHVAKDRPVGNALGRALHHEDDEHVVAGVEPPVRSTRAAPRDLADRRGVRGLARARANGESETEPVARSGQVQRRSRDRCAQLVA